MASMVASIPITGAIVSAAACCSGRGSFADRPSFEYAEANPSGRLIARPTRDSNGGAFGRREANSSSRFAARAAAQSEEVALSGVVFEPFAEVQSLLSKLPEKASGSLARQRFNHSCESAINEQINVEYNASYLYHALYAYFDRDDVALPGLAKYFKESSEEEREHAEKFIVYQNQRGGRVKLLSIVQQPSEFANSVKGDALYAMELTLSLEKLVTEKLYNLHQVAEDAGDIHLADFVEGEWLTEQIESIKKISGFVSQLRRIGNDGHGVVYWDRELLEEGGEGA